MGFCELSRCASVAQSVEQGTENPCVDGSIPSGGTKLCGSGSVVERHLAKVNVASSNLVFRSTNQETHIASLDLPKINIHSFAPQGFEYLIYMHGAMAKW